MANNHGHHSDEHSGQHHIIPFDILVKVAVGLLILTILTVVTAKFLHLGPLTDLVAFGIAAAKAYLVMAYFMGLKYDDKLNRIIFGSGFFFLFLLFIFCALDIWTRIGQSNTL